MCVVEKNGKNGYPMRDTTKPISPIAETKPSGLYSCSVNIQTTLEYVFGKLGYIVGTHPWYTIFGTLIFAFLFGIGFLGWTTEYRVNKLWIPPDSRAIHENEWIIDTFGYESRTTQILMRPNNYANNVLTPHYIQQYWIAHYLLINTSTTAPKNYKSQFPDYYSFDGYNNSVPICFRRGIECQKDTILDIFGYTYDDVMNLTSETILNKINNENYISSNLQTELQNILGGIEYDENDNIIGAAILRGVYIITADAIDENNEFIDPSRQEWELTVSQKIFDYSFVSSKVIIYNDAAFLYEFEQAIYGDLALLGVGCTLLLIYCAIALGKRDYVYSGIGLGISAIVTIGLCILASFGLAGAFQIMFTDFSTCLPFLILGLGVDDSFIIFGEFQQQIKEHPNNRNTAFLMQNTMQHAGISILITSLTSTMAFLIGATTVLPSLNAFCLYAAFAVIFVFLFQVTFFSATVCIDYERTAAEQQRYDLCCCYKAKRKHFMYPSSENEISSYLYCLHKIPNEISKTMFKKIGEMLTNGIVQAVVLVIFVSTVALSIYFATFLKQDFNIEWFLPDSSYLQQYYEWRDNYFKSTSSVFLYTTDINYYQNKDALFKANDLLSNANYLTGMYIDWHSSFWNYLNETNQTSFINNDNYIQFLYSYLYFSGSGFEYFGFIKFDNDTNPTQINGAFMIGEYNSGNVNNAEKQVEAMDKIRADVANIMSRNKMFPFSFEMLFWEQFKVIANELYRNLGLAVGVILIITLFLIPKLITALLVLVTVFATIANVLGFMYLWDLTIDGIATCYIIIAIGLSVDYSAHIGESFMISNKSNKKLRVIDALHRTGAAVFNGGFSTFLAVLTMSFSGTYVFRVFFKVFFLVCLFGLLHGLIVLPVLLLLFGPNTTLKQDQKVILMNEKTPLREDSQSMTRSMKGQAAYLAPIASPPLSSI